VIGAVIVVVALIAVGVALATGGDGGAPAAATPTPTAGDTPTPSASPTVAPPLSFTAKSTTVPFGVVLRWSAPSGQTVLAYVLFRQGKQIATQPGADTSYTDSDVKPGKSYTYEIQARASGTIESEKVSAQVKVRVPPLSMARVNGNYNAKLHTTSQFGYIGSVDDGTFGWNFKPKCRVGACDVTWKDLFYKDLKTVLDRAGATYTGSDSGKFFGKCSGVAGTSTVTLDLHVTKARVIDGVWSATKLEGTFVEGHPSVLGCVSGGAHFNATVTLVD
jgi:hypothetical protein